MEAVLRFGVSQGVCVCRGAKERRGKLEGRPGAHESPTFLQEAGAECSIRI